MTIDEMIKYLIEPELDIPEGTLKKVAAALRAGQAMRNCFIAITDDTDVPWSVDIKRVNLGASGLAWDAATQEEV